MHKVQKWEGGIRKGVGHYSVAPLLWRALQESEQPLFLFVLLTIQLQLSIRLKIYRVKTLTSY